jgi:hypothetical protein
VGERRARFGKQNLTKSIPKIIANGEGTSAVIAVNFPIVETRYVRVTLKKSSANWWSISEFRFFE